MDVKSNDPFDQEVMVFKNPEKLFASRYQFAMGLSCATILPLKRAVMDFDDSRPGAPASKSFNCTIRTASFSEKCVADPKTKEELKERYPNATITEDVLGMTLHTTISKNFVVVDEIVDRYISSLITEKEDAWNCYKSSHKRASDLFRENTTLKERNLFQRIFKVGE